jgi:hypothetical protein
MRKSAAMLAYVFIGWSCTSTGGRVGEPRARVATIATLAGAVEVLRGGHIDWAALRARDELFDEDRVRTFRGARAQLLFPGGSTLRVEEESLISLGAISMGGGIVVERGTVEGELKAGLRLDTPALEARTAPARDIVIQ